jgi:polysaccharide deacetylase 2 family uncharacterized protein YibQ
MKKLYIVRKYVIANSITDAIKKEKKVEIDDCWLDDDFKRASIDNMLENKKNIGFKNK